MPQQNRDLCFQDDFAGTFPCAAATGGHSGSGISPPTVSCPFAPTNIIGRFCPIPSLAIEPAVTASFGPPKALVPIVAANKAPDSTRSDAFIVASCDKPFARYF
jgi:hypothetical protein